MRNITVVDPQSNNKATVPFSGSTWGELVPLIEQHMNIQLVKFKPTLKQGETKIEIKDNSFVIPEEHNLKIYLFVNNSKAGR